MKIAICVIALAALVNLGLARPQVNLIIDTGFSVEEVVRPEEKQRVLNEFQGRSILYQSLPEFQGIPREEIVVESPVLVLTKPKDRNAKRREMAEKRTSS